ncbi:MAG: hypothetical protein IT310_00705 [Anaerolineales bacterium]|nr:hypothetical protein [Anaerolineales bacterium]
MKKHFVPLLFLTLISALAYLPHVFQFGYFRDDWYLMYAANAIGRDVFQQIYAIDRPLRAGLMSVAYLFFGLNPLYYNLAAYLFRLLGGFSFFWSLQMVWPRQRNANLLAAVLFLIFPGFLSTPNAIDYQAQQFSLGLALASIALSLAALRAQDRRWLALAWLVVGGATFYYLGLVEYFLGLEVLRLALIFVDSRSSLDSFWQTCRKALVNWLPFSLGALSFFIWRFFIFDSERKATDLGAQVGRLLQSPLLVSVQWLKALIKDVFEVTLLAWWEPLFGLWNMSLRLRETLLIGLIAALAILLTTLALRSEMPEEDVERIGSWWSEAFGVGLLVTVAGFLPVILSNRDADFEGLSRYMLASSAGAAILTAALLNQFRVRRAYVLAACLLITASTLTHYLNGMLWAKSSQQMREFWWQVSWRIPQLKPGATLVVNYSHMPVEEDYFIWGPANLIYAPQSKNPQRVEPELWGLVLTSENASSILERAEPKYVNRRSMITYLGYDNVLVLTQPTLASCVQALDGRLPITSTYEQADIREIAKESNLDDVILNSKTSARPPEVVFGPEPDHTWCYYYQTASLALQNGDFETVLNLRREAEHAGFAAQDSAEWVPFLQAAILSKNYAEADELTRRIKKDSSVQTQVCAILQTLPNLEPEMKTYIQSALCVK